MKMLHEVAKNGASVHELHHAHQYELLDDSEKYQVSRESIDAWKLGFDTYEIEQAKRG